MTTRDYDRRKRRVLRAFHAGDPAFEQQMDDLTVGCSETQWNDLARELNALTQEREAGVFWALRSAQ